ncbi:uncharacterized protein BX663DRAFT_276711 [Cokeromyces recurvatus]|uniref:uncharacterized protein n=1 Tax=Cokeromyces recurvatus TaxID=90255 RepID=UPI002220D2A0|nr:uncharacterized protein BX663DRAFT_276711 [Cokeromyces recurvatus]KAI7897868.1 hypothetical protein BX663DRAFT_276711 [Cokeromyces recurvatus]
MNNYTTTSAIFGPSITANAYTDTLTTSEQVPSSTLLHHLHINERQLRTLAVVLSLTGGLAISFALGVGIMIYWYFRKCKQRRHFHDSVDQGPCTLSTCQAEEETEVVNSELREITNTSNKLLLKSSSTAIMSSVVIDQGMNSSSIMTDLSLVSPLLLSPPVSNSFSMFVPEPSAPSAKELLLLHQSSSSTNTPNHFPQQQSCITTTTATNTAITTTTTTTTTTNDNDSNDIESLCHDCSIPPPAYTKD